MALYARPRVSPRSAFIGACLVVVAAGPLVTAGEEPSGRAATQSPCLRDDAFAQFDFWIGDWEVFTAAGRKAGENHITRIENGCLLVEKWTSASGSTGTSMNYYDPSRKLWAQHWVSQDGVIIDIEGALQGNSMVLSGRSHYTASGRSASFRGKWTPLPDGRVRQFFEESNDRGQTWEPWFEGFYVRRRPAPAAAP